MVDSQKVCRRLFVMTGAEDIQKMFGMGLLGKLSNAVIIREIHRGLALLRSDAPFDVKVDDVVAVHEEQALCNVQCQVLTPAGTQGQ